MVNEEQKTEESVAEDGTPETPSEQVATPDDEPPMTIRALADEAAETKRQVVKTAKEGFLRPAFRVGRRLLRRTQTATESFFDGALNDKKGDK